VRLGLASFGGVVLTCSAWDVMGALCFFPRLLFSFLLDSLKCNFTPDSVDMGSSPRSTSSYCCTTEEPAACGDISLSFQIPERRKQSADQ